MALSSSASSDTASSSSSGGGGRRRRRRRVLSVQSLLDAVRARFSLGGAGSWTAKWSWASTRNNANAGDEDVEDGGGGAEKMDVLIGINQQYVRSNKICFTFFKYCNFIFIESIIIQR
jgi:hypothetical protein